MWVGHYAIRNGAYASPKVIRQVVIVQDTAIPSEGSMQPVRFVPVSLVRVTWNPSSAHFDKALARREKELAAEIAAAAAELAATRLAEIVAAAAKGKATPCH